MLDQRTKIEAKQYARKALRVYLGVEEQRENLPDSPTLLESLGVFVTLTNHGKLRGCLGDIETNKPLYQSIQELAVAAASRDWRFNPVTQTELEDIEIEISILTKPRRINDWQEIILGKHGVIIERDGHKGVFLPQVALEGKFSLEAFLGLLCSQKAGLPAEAYRDTKTKIETFEAEVF